MTEKVLKLGAEARLSVKGNRLFKERIKKGYRLAEIDEPLRKQRTAREASLLDKARRAGVNVPVVRKVDNKNMTIEMDLIDGKRIDQVLTEGLAAKTGAEIAKLHDAGIIHGDLTTSNILVAGAKGHSWAGAQRDGAQLQEKHSAPPCPSAPTPLVYFIDFGLGEVSDSVEKKGVDLRVFKEAIRATKGEDADKYIDAAIDSYKKSSKQGKEVLARLEEIEKRGRYKER